MTPTPMQSMPRTSSNTCGEERWVMPGQGLAALSGEGVAMWAGTEAPSACQGPAWAGGGLFESGDAR